MSNQLFGDSQSLESLLDAYLDFGVPKTGELRDGHIVARHNNVILIDIGAKSEGIIPASEVDQLNVEFEVGQEIRTYVVNPEDEKGNIILSYMKVAEESDWTKAETHKETQNVCECLVVGHNRGGILTKMGTLGGFIPASQLASANQVKRSQSADTQLRSLVGKTLTVCVLEADREQARLIMSELAAEQKIKSKQRRKRIAELTIGDICEGEVINLTDFGAFVDIRGLEGLVHMSELSWKHIKKPSDILSVGETVKVALLSIDEEKQRVTLSMKQTETNPWAVVHDFYKEGQLVEVTVTQLTRYGAFARINDTYRLEGLIHISELSDEHIKSPNEIVRKGQKITVRVIRIDAPQQQIGFSVKQVFSEKYMESDLAAEAQKPNDEPTEEVLEIEAVPKVEAVLEIESVPEIEEVLEIESVPEIEEVPETELATS